MALFLYPFWVGRDNECRGCSEPSWSKTLLKIYIDIFLNYEIMLAQMKNAVCKNGILAGTSRRDVRFSGQPRHPCRGFRSCRVEAKRRRIPLCWALPYSIFYLPSSVFSAFRFSPSLVASVPAKWLLKILKLRNKPIFEPTRNSLQPIMNYNVISDFEPDLSRQFRKNKPI